MDITTCIIILLTLGVGQGEVIEIQADGPDAQQAVEALKNPETTDFGAHRRLQKILTSFFQCVKVSLFFFRTPVHMHVLTIPPTRDRGYTDGRVKCRKPVEEPGTAPRVRVGNFVALLIERKSSSF